jgi:hypothetical protein
MADTVRHAPDIAPSEGPSLGLEAFRTNGIAKDAPIPPAAALDLSTLDITDPELWRRNAFWDRFARLRREDPVHWCPDSPYGPTGRSPPTRTS